MQFKKLFFLNRSGQQLSARLDFPVDRRPLAYALFAHCFTCTKNLKAADHISRALVRRDIAVLRFDFTGLGESEGDFAGTNFSSNVDDLIAAADFLKSDFEAPQILIGHSLGGAAVLQAAARIDSVRAVATIAAPSNTAHLAKLLQNMNHRIETDGEAEVTLAGRTFKITRQFIDDLEQTRMQTTIQQLRKALLLFHSPLDNIVAIDNAARIFQTARHPKSFISLDQADHLLSNAQDSRYVGLMIAAWAQKYITVVSPHPESRPDTKHQVTVQTNQSGFLTEVTAGRHRLIMDEPVAYGGTDRGATPFDCLLAALGACTSMTLRMYADRKDLPLDSILVRLKHRKVHAELCETCESRNNFLDHIDREIELIGTINDDQKTKLLAIADKCPVHRTLTSDIEISTRLKKPDPEK